MICFNCGKIGHLEENCQHDSMEDIEPHVQLNRVNIPVLNCEVEDNNFGSRMLVKKPPRRRYIKQDKQTDKQPVVGSGKHHSNVNSHGTTVGQPPLQNRQTDPVEGSRFYILGEDTSPQDPLIIKTVDASTRGPMDHLVSLINFNFDF